MKNISIIIPAHNPDPILLKRLTIYLKENATKNMEVLIVDGKNGLARAYNEGIKKSKGEIIVTIHSDCVPLEKDSLQELIKPFEDTQVVLTYAWLLQEDIKKKIYPKIPDQKFNAFRKSALKKVGLFDEDHFLTGGEDVDIWLKLKKVGRIRLANTGVLHTHPNYLGNLTLEKRKQNGSINGALFRIWGFKNPKWLGAFFFCLKYPFSYGKYFIKAFITKKQDYRRRS